MRRRIAPETVTQDNLRDTDRVAMESVLSRHSGIRRVFGGSLNILWNDSIPNSYHYIQGKFRAWNEIHARTYFRKKINGGIFHEITYTDRNSKTNLGCIMPLSM